MVLENILLERAPETPKLEFSQNPYYNMNLFARNNWNSEKKFGSSLKNFGKSKFFPGILNIFGSMEFRRSCVQLGRILELLGNSLITIRELFSNPEDHSWKLFGSHVFSA
jgi:hypothetical protein